MTTTSDLLRLGDFFDPQDIAWKPIAVSKKTGKALAAAYLSNRAIMDRLDNVCGPAAWRNEYQPGPNGGIICGLSIRVTHADGSVEWVTKWDGADNTDIEPVKGGLSSSMRRAAVQWGIGRYLYNLPQLWVPVDERGRFAQQPQIPRQFLPRPQQQTRSGNQATPSQSRANGGDGAPGRPHELAPQANQRGEERRRR